MDLAWTDVLKLVAAVLAGALIGFERQFHGKTAGFRTNILICLGAALFTVMSVHFAAAARVADPARIAAQIVTGVGFLGAGAILQQRRQVVGLTTAATIWAVASVGMAFGAGAYILGTVGTLMIAGVLQGLGYAEKLLARWRTVTRLEVRFSLDLDAARVVRELARRHGVDCRSMKLSKSPDCYVGRLKLAGPKPALDAFHAALLRADGVEAVGYSDNL